MGSYALSGAADADILYIARDSLKHWGPARAERYILGLHETFERLADFPDMGRTVDEIRPGYMRMDSLSHSIFYRKTETGILVMCVLHERMDFRRHL